MDKDYFRSMPPMHRGPSPKRRKRDELDAPLGTPFLQSLLWQGMFLGNENSTENNTYGNLSVHSRNGKLCPGTVLSSS